MLKNVRTALFAVALTALAAACNNAGTEDNKVVNSTETSETTLDDAMNTSGDTATVVRTDSTALQEAEQMGSEAKDATKGAASDAKDAVKQ